MPTSSSASDMRCLAALALSLSTCLGVQRTPQTWMSRFLDVGAGFKPSESMKLRRTRTSSESIDVKAAPPKLTPVMRTKIAEWRLGKEFFATTTCMNASVDVSHDLVKRTGLSEMSSIYTFWVEKNTTGQAVFRVEKFLDSATHRSEADMERLDGFTSVVRALPAYKLTPDSPLFSSQPFSILADWCEARGNDFSTDLPVWSYNREGVEVPIANRKAQVLFPLLKNHAPTHFWNFGIKSSDTTPWEHKKNALYWAGSVSGSPMSPNSHTTIERTLKKTITNLARENPAALDDYDRAWVVKHLGNLTELNGTEIHVGFAEDRIGNLSSFLIENGFKIQPWLTPIEMDKYKFIMVLDGNDFYPSLPSALLSSSVPILFTPSHWETIMNYRLTAWDHYIPVQRSIDDINLKISWCRQNEAMCRRIAENGRVFMKTLWSSSQDEDLIRMRTLELAAGQILKTCKSESKLGDVAKVIEAAEVEISDGASESSRVTMSVGVTPNGGALLYTPPANYPQLNTTGSSGVQVDGSPYGIVTYVYTAEKTQDNSSDTPDATPSNQNITGEITDLAPFSVDDIPYHTVDDTTIPYLSPLNMGDLSYGVLANTYVPDFSSVNTSLNTNHTAAQTGEKSSLPDLSPMDVNHNTNPLRINATKGLTDSLLTLEPLSKDS